MIDATDIICPVIHSQPFERIMAIATYYGHGAVGARLGLLLLGYGHFQTIIIPTKNRAPASSIA